MIRLRRSIALAGAICAVIGGAPAHAALDWPGVQEAFDSGRNSGITPQNDGEYAMCAGFWSIWSDALGMGALGTVLPDTLDNRLGVSETEARTHAWLEIVEARELEPEYATEVDSARSVMNEVIRKDAAATKDFFEVLGVCLALPTAE